MTVGSTRDVIATEIFLPGYLGRQRADNILGLRAEERLFFGGGKKEADDDYFGYYDYYFNPDQGFGHGAGEAGPPPPRHHFMNRDGPEPEYEENEDLLHSVTGFSITDFLQSLLNLSQR